MTLNERIEEAIRILNTAEHAMEPEISVLRDCQQALKVAREALTAIAGDPRYIGSMAAEPVPIARHALVYLEKEYGK